MLTMAVVLRATGAASPGSRGLPELPCFAAVLAVRAYMTVSSFPTGPRRSEAF